MIEIVHNTDYVGQALARLPSQYKDKPRIAALVTIFANECQQVEDAFFEIIVGRLLQYGNPTGDLLAKIGEIVGQANTVGASDTEYLTLITARIAANRSSGARPSLIKVLQLLVPGQDVLIQKNNGAVYVQVVDALTLPAPLVAFGFLQPLLLAGVRLYFAFTKVADAQTLTMGSAYLTTNPTASQSPGSVYATGEVTNGGQLAAVFSGADGVTS